MAKIRLLDDGEVRPKRAPKGKAPVFGPGAGMRRFRCEDEDRRPGDVDIVFHQSAYRTVVEHLSRDVSREHGGLLLGFETRDPHGSISTVFVTHALPAWKADGTPTRLRLSEDVWAEFDAITDGYGDSGLELCRVGWYHSHPNLPIFLSDWDLDVCTVFPRSTQVALVVDPVRHHGGFFVRGEGYRNHSPQGFWELADVRGETVVTWTNVIEEEHTPAPGAPPVPVEQQVPPKRLGSPWHVAAVAVTLVGAFAFVRLFGHLNQVEARLTDRVADGLSSHDARIERFGTELRTAIENETENVALAAARAVDVARAAEVSLLEAEIEQLRARAEDRATEIARLEHERSVWTGLARDSATVVLRVRHRALEVMQAAAAGYAWLRTLQWDERSAEDPDVDVEAVSEPEACGDAQGG